VKRNEGIWVHLCCEGWVRLGPFAWVGVDDGGNALIDEHGDVIATSDDDGWQVPGNRYRGFRFRTPMVTASRRHPSPMQGGFPISAGDAT
jgi:hypothetical protein